MKIFSPDFNTSPSTRGFIAPRIFHTAIGISIPAPPRGASRRFLWHFLEARFQYQPLHEGLQYPAGCYRAPCYFNTSPSTRGFSTELHNPNLPRYFNTSPSTRGFKTMLLK